MGSTEGTKPKAPVNRVMGERRGGGEPHRFSKLYFVLIRALSLAQGDRGQKGPVLAGNKHQDWEGVGLIEKDIRGRSRQGVGMEVGRDEM